MPHHGKTPSLAKLNKRMILSRLRQGEFVTQIAPDIGITRQAICLALAHYKAYQQARRQGSIYRLSIAHGRAKKWEEYRYLVWFGPDEFSQKMGFSPRLSPADQVLDSLELSTGKRALNRGKLLKK